MNTPLKQERRIIVLLALINFTHIMDFMIMMPLGPNIMRTFHILPHQFAWLVSSYNIFAGVSAFASLFYADNFDRKKLLNVAYFGFILCTLGCALSNSYYTLTFFRACTGIFGGIISSQVMAIIGDAFPLEKRGRAFGMVMLGFSLASVIGVPFGLFIASKFLWHTPFFLLTALATLVMVGSFILLPSFNSHLHTTHHESPWLKVKNLWSSINQRKAIFFETFQTMGHFAIIPFISPYFVKNLSFPEIKLGFIYMCGGLITMLVSPFAGKLTDKIGSHKIYLIFSVLALFPVLLITHLPPMAWYFALIATSLFFFTASGRMVPANTLVISSIPPQQRGGFMGVKSAAQSLSMGLSVYIGGLILGQDSTGNMTHYHFVGYMAVGFSLIAILLSRKIRLV